MKYHGLRWDNVRYNRTPKEDFGIFYFTSRASLKKEFKNNKKNFNFKITYTFSNKKEAQKYEKEFNEKIIGKSRWLNQSAYPHLIQSDEGKERIRQSRLGSIFFQKNIEKIKKSGTGLKRSEKTKKKMSKVQRSLNKIQSESTKKQISKTKKSQNLSAWNKNRKWSSSERKRISRGMKGKMKGKKNPFYGKKHSKKTIEKMRLARLITTKNPTKKMIEGRINQAKKMKGHKVSIKTRKKISLANIGNQYNLGRKVSKETREKISLGNKGKKRSNKLKKQISKSLKKYYRNK